MNMILVKGTAALVLIIAFDLLMFACAACAIHSRPAWVSPVATLGHWRVSQGTVLLRFPVAACARPRAPSSRPFLAWVGTIPGTARIPPP